MLATSYQVDESMTILDSAPSAPAAVPAQPEAVNPLLTRLLKIADSYHAENAPRQAIEIYFELVENHPDTPEAQQAQRRLTEIGEQYEQSGGFRQARSLYQRLL